MTTSNAVPACQYCGSSIPHIGVCPSVKAFEYYPDGTLKRVELKTANDYPPVISSSPRDWLTGATPNGPASAHGTQF